MSQFYSDSEREHETYSLPDAETFYMTASDFVNAEEGTWMHDRMSDDRDASADSLAGWYYWFCIPGCLPDSEPSGPFETEQDAIDDASQNG
jgi:hypothetical protein